MPEIPEQQMEFEAPENVVNMSAPKAGGNLKIGNSGFARDSDFIPVYVPQPQYPRRAQTRGKEGYAVVEVIITTTGGVRDPILIEEWPEGWGFGRSALKASNKLKYNPSVVDGVPQEVTGVMYKNSPFRWRSKGYNMSKNISILKLFTVASVCFLLPLVIGSINP